MKQPLNMDVDGCVCTSGGFDPIHIGHIRCLQESSAIAAELAADLVVIVNADAFLIRKKDYVFMPLQERMEIVHAVIIPRLNSYVLPWDDGSQNVAEALRLLKPKIFTKGGDRTPNNMDPAEVTVCQEIGCEIRYGVGGSKVQSSSRLVADCRPVSMRMVK